MQTYENAVPKYAKRLSGNDYYWSLKSARPVPVRVISLGILNQESATFIQPRLGVAIMLDHLMRDWWQALCLKRGFTDQNVDDRAAVAHVLSPMTTVRCSVAQNVSNSDHVILFPNPGSSNSYLKRNLSQHHLDNEPSQHVRFSWVPPDDQDDTVSASGVFQSPWTSDNQSRVAIGCTVQAQWVPAQIHTDAYSFWQGWYPKNISFGEALPSAGHAVVNGSTAYNKRNAISIDNNWLSMLTPPIGKGQPGYQDWTPTTIEGILSSAHLTDGLFAGDDRAPVDAWKDEARTRTKLLMSIIGSVFNDGLARVGIEDAFDRTGPPSNWTPSVPMIADDSNNKTVQREKPARRPIPAADRTIDLQVNFSISGISYRLTLVQKLAMAVLLLHILIATVHVVWILWKQESSGCWDSIIELLVLAQNSRPAFSALRNTAAGVKHSRTFATQVMIRPTRISSDSEADHLEMVYGEEENHKQESEMSNLGRDQNVDVHTEGGRVSHPLTWPLRRHYSQVSTNGSLEQQASDAEIDLGTPLIGAAANAGLENPVDARVMVGRAYG